jgi:SAM-dependent methyltransferase
VCGERSTLLFAEERLDASRIDALTYASRKPPEFMCWRLVRCLGCDLVFAETPPGHDFLGTAYAQAGYDSAEEAQAAATTYSEALKIHVKRLQRLGPAVDVGAGSGPLLPLLESMGLSPVLGVEPSHAAIAAASPAVRPKLRQGMFSRALIGDLRPVLICCFMTLEHIADPAGFLATAVELLEPGGMVAVVVHNWRAVPNRLLGMRSPIIDVEHLQLYSPRSVRSQLERAGLASIEVQPLVNTYALRYWVRLAPLPRLLRQPLEGLLSLSGMARLQVSLPVGNLLAVGFKR